MKNIPLKISNLKKKYKILILVLILILYFVFYLFLKKIELNYLLGNSKNDQIESYIISQKDFCENNNKYYNEKYEKELILMDAKINELKFKMYIFKAHGFIIADFQKYEAYELSISNNIIKALKFYSYKKNITNNKDIFMLDIGTNIGWYPSFLGRYGYTILCFEAFEKNYYVAKKNYCYLNKNSNVIIIPKGIGAKNKKCQYFINLNNAGNGMVLCDNKNIKDKTFSGVFKKDSEVEITTLNTFFPYLLNKNIALMKIDIEGYEFEALLGGKELITKYHVPFIVLEFSPPFLKEIGSEPIDLIKFFIDQGYKISLNGFLNQDFITTDELLKKSSFQINCYFIHESIFK